MSDGPELLSLPRRTLRFARRVLGHFLEHKGLLLAGAVAYNTLLSLVPVLALLLVALAHAFEPEVLIRIVEAELHYLTPGQVNAVSATVSRFLQERQLIGGVGFVALLFFGTLAFRSLEEAMEVIFRHHEAGRRRFWISALIPFVYMFGVALMLLLLTVVTGLLDAHGRELLSALDLDFEVAALTSGVLRALGFVGLVLLLGSIYHVLPTARVRLRLAWIGAFVAALLWEGARALLVWYFANLSLVNVVYGSLATVVVLLLSLEVGALIVLLGAQVIAELERSARRGVPWYVEPPTRRPGDGFDEPPPHRNPGPSGP